MQVAGRYAGAARRSARVAVWLMIAAALGLVSAGVGCTGLPHRAWGKDAVFIGFDPDTLNRGGSADFSILVSLTEVYYQRMVDRRFNSKATFDDPGLREFFRSGDAFADYYAALAEALERANFESHRPTVINLLGIERDGRNAANVRVYIKGENGLPLRWWSTDIVRDDRWEYANGRWWVIPGKV
jgi:hypothetical protein